MPSFLILRNRVVLWIFKSLAIASRFQSFFFKTEMDAKFLTGQLLLMSNLAGKYTFDPHIFSGVDTGIPFMGGSDNSSASNEFIKIVEKIWRIKTAISF